jgi:two-component system osmolarity sensor histidine kinase EnvZ
MRMKLEQEGSGTVVESGRGRDEFSVLYEQIERIVSQPFMITRGDNDFIRVTFALEEGMLRISIPRKRVASSTTYLFVIWMVASSLLLTVIATLFLRSQIRPIVQLARAAEQFGLGREVERFSPRGASEVRRAGRAFMVMAERISRQVQSRTEMLAGISHDLRTPLTRMMLEIEMSTMDEKSKAALSADVKEMRHMIDEYLSFARADADEQLAQVDVSEELRAMVDNYQRSGAEISLTLPEKRLLIQVRRQALLRGLQNVIDNALRYGKCAHVCVEEIVANYVIEISDEGPGIPEEFMAEAFKPFTRLENSRNSKTGGVGLGLAIARDNIQRMGGEITLSNIISDVGAVCGLRVRITIPRAEHVQQIS